MIRRAKNIGATLLELVVATLVFSVALGALLSGMTTILQLIDHSRDQTVAVTDLRNMLEKIRATAFANMQARFPNGVANGPAGNRYSTLLGGYTLRNEQITVTYPSVGADPLEIRVTVNWQDKRSRNWAVSGSTFKTR